MKIKSKWKWLTFDEWGWYVWKSKPRYDGARVYYSGWDIEKNGVSCEMKIELFNIKINKSKDHSKNIWKIVKGEIQEKSK